MGDAWRIGTDPRQRTPLVTAGLFAIVRNPIYASLIPVLLGLALLVPSVAALASVALFVAAIEIETRYVEEPHLRRLHGRDYDRYAARTGRFLPGVGLLPEQTS
jgi:protein-S-isoprenylcysteine O-methyltransferase Ste14